MGLIGRVTADREARIPRWERRDRVVSGLLLVGSGEGTEREVTAVIDTGFNGVLGLPTRLIEELGLTRVGRERMLLANGDLHFDRT